MTDQTSIENWEYLRTFLPEGWEQMATETRALERKREIKDPETLLRLLMLHLYEGKSLRQTVAHAKTTELCHINDSALLHRLKRAGDWFLWMAQQLRNRLGEGPDLSGVASNYRLRIVDGTNVSEPGSTGSDWRVHYSMRLGTLLCDGFRVTDKRVGEDLSRFDIRSGDLILGDRAYCRRKGVSYVLDSGGEVLLRWHSSSFPLKTSRGQSFDVLGKLRSLPDGETGDWDVYFYHVDGRLVKGRLLAVRKSPESQKISIKKIKQKASRQQRKARLETLEYGEYFIIFTTVNRHRLKKETVFLLYKARWQVELKIKRMKGIIKLGHLPKYDERSCRSWLQGKMMLALLVERVHMEAESISPWGFPLGGPRHGYGRFGVDGQAA